MVPVFTTQWQFFFFNVWRGLWLISLPTTYVVSCCIKGETPMYSLRSRLSQLLLLPFSSKNWIFTVTLFSDESCTVYNISHQWILPPYCCISFGPATPLLYPHAQSCSAYCGKSVVRIIFERGSFKYQHCCEISFPLTRFLLYLGCIAPARQQCWHYASISSFLQRKPTLSVSQPDYTIHTPFAKGLHFHQGFAV